MTDPLEEDMSRYDNLISDIFPNSAQPVIPTWLRDVFSSTDTKRLVLCVYYDNDELLVEFGYDVDVLEALGALEWAKVEYAKGGW